MALSKAPKRTKESDDYAALRLTHAFLCTSNCAASDEQWVALVRLLYTNAERTQTLLLLQYTEAQGGRLARGAERVLVMLRQRGEESARAWQEPGCLETLTGQLQTLAARAADQLASAMPADLAYLLARKARRGTRWEEVAERVLRGMHVDELVHELCLIDRANLVPPCQWVSRADVLACFSDGVSVMDASALQLDLSEYPRSGELPIYNAYVQLAAKHHASVHSRELALYGRQLAHEEAHYPLMPSTLSPPRWRLADHGAFWDRLPAVPGVTRWPMPQNSSDLRIDAALHQRRATTVCLCLYKEVRSQLRARSRARASFTPTRR